MLALPILVYLFSLNIVTASAYALFITGATSMAGFALKWSENLTDPRAAVVFGIPSVLVSFATRRWIVDAIPGRVYLGMGAYLDKEVLLLGLFSLLMMVSAVMMITRKNNPAGSRGPDKAYLLFPAGLGTGLIAGLAGVGGGFLILPSLMVFGRLSFPVAVGTTLIIIALNSLVGFCGDVINNSIQWSFLFIVTGFCVVGLMIGYLVKEGISRYVNPRSFGWIMAVLGAGMVIRQLFT